MCMTLTFKVLDGDESGIENLKNPIHPLSCLWAYSYVGMLVTDGEHRVHQQGEADPPTVALRCLCQRKENVQ